ncbi:MAG: hypothetical protein KJ579_12160, partial [Verrucomicrobia bacterium]|nr:hypothetical protein [Verrucomicrobiota bacterium]
TRNRKNARTSLWETVLQLTVAKPYCSGTGAIGGAIPGEWNPWETYPDRGSVTQRCYFRNLTRAQVDIILATLTNATSNDPNVGEPNRFGLYDGHITVAPWTVNIGGTGWAPGSGSVVGYTWDRRDTDPDGGNKCVRKLTWTIGRIASASKSTVNGYIGGKGSPDSGELRGGFWGTFRTLTSVGEWQETP